MTNTAAILAKLEADPPEVDVAPILALHRGQDSFVGFVRKPTEPTVGKDGKPVLFENLFSIPVKDLREMFPALAKWLIQDAYFTVNSMHRAAPWNNKLTGYKDVLRSEPKPGERGHLRYMNACYVDLDVGREDDPDPTKRATWRDAAAAAGNMMDAGLLPQASIFARSGRGVYLFWMLRDDKQAHLPPRFWPEKLTLYKMVNRAIVSRTKHLAADKATIDAVRVLRVPGTRHAKTHRAAAYQIQLDENGHGYTYTLSEMAQFFGVPETQTALPEATRQTALVDTPTPRGRQTKLVGSQPGRKGNFHTLYCKRAQDFLILEQARGGWPQGQRRKRLTMYAEFLRFAGNAPQTTLTAVLAMAGNCKPPYPSADDTATVLRIVGDVYTKPKPRSYRNVTLCQMLKVTPELARSLELKTIVPDEVRAERRPPPGGHRALHLAEVTEFVRRYLATHRHATARGTTTALADAGLKTNRDRVNKILNELGHQVQGRGRPTVARSYGSKPPTSPRKSGDTSTQPPQQNATASRISASLPPEPWQPPRTL